MRQRVSAVRVAGEVVLLSLAVWRSGMAAVRLEGDSLNCKGKMWTVSFRYLRYFQTNTKKNTFWNWIKLISINNFDCKALTLFHRGGAIYLAISLTDWLIYSLTEKFALAISIKYYDYQIVPDDSKMVQNVY